MKDAKKMKNIEFKMCSKPKINYNSSGWMKVEATISNNGRGAIKYILETNGFGQTALIGRYSVNTLRDIISIWNENPEHDTKLRDYANKILEAYKITSEAEKNLEVA